MKKLFALILTLALAFSFTACGSAPTTENTENDTQQTEQTKTFTEAEIEQAAAQLRLDSLSAQAAGDYDAYAALFVNTDEATVKANFDHDTKYSDYDQHFTIFIGTDGEYYAVSYTDAIVSGTYPDTNTNRSSYAMIMVYTEDGWKYDIGSAANDKFYSNVYPSMPEGFADAATNGRNAIFFEFGNFMYMDAGSKYIKGDFSAVLTTLWQDAEGNVYAGVFFNNGTDGNRTADEVYLTLTDSSLGIIFEGLLGDETVISGSSKYTVYTIPADQVVTGTATWSSINSNLKHKNI